RLAPVTKAILPVKSNKSFIIIPYIFKYIICFIHFGYVVELSNVTISSTKFINFFKKLSTFPKI
ncbi:hypothetical protein MT378_21030, partial [Psychrobacter sp. 16-Bac2893]